MPSDYKRDLDLNPGDDDRRPGGQELQLCSPCKQCECTRFKQSADYPKCGTAGCGHHVGVHKRDDV